MGLQSVLPGKHTTKRNKAHKVYPYLLRNLAIDRPNHVWVTDITYIPIKKGFMRAAFRYLTAFMDVYSRKVLSRNLSNSMDAEWCQEVLQEAIQAYGLPEIINTMGTPSARKPVYLRSVYKLCFSKRNKTKYGWERESHR